ncbi:MAG: hypothetical protein Q9191_000908 [Dirinaria sp. TL-2023a]
MAEQVNTSKGNPYRPMNVGQIVHKAQNYEYNEFIPLKYWLRTAGILLKEVFHTPNDKSDGSHVIQADIYEQEGNDQQTYLLLFRHAQLVVNKLSSHPDARQPKNRTDLAQASREVQSSLQKLEILKPRINKRYERYEQLLHDRDTRRASSDAKDTGSTKNIPLQDGSHRRLPSDPAVAGSNEAIAAHENKDLAVKLAHHEIRRRATARKATRKAGISEEQEHERRTAGLWGDWEEAFTKNDHAIDQDTLSRQMQKVRLQVNGSVSGRNPGSRRPSFENLRSGYHYPEVPSLHDRQPSPAASSEWLSSENDDHAPRLPPKYVEPPQRAGPVPPRPAKEELPAERHISPAAIPSSTDNIQPSTFTFKPSAYLENGTPLRTVFLPPDLRHRFLSLALPNTHANLETCGILCGTLISNALFISKLVIPDQESTSDTCETVNESELFDFVDGEDLMVLGWIHTHPTQTCFMSSRDLHTHAGYQMMMPESIAIVCAPSKGE